MRSVQLPGRRFPGVVFQGDSLHSLLVKIEGIQRLAKGYKDEDLDIELLEVQELLSDVVSHYELVCETAGRSLPYEKL